MGRFRRSLRDATFSSWGRGGGGWSRTRPSYIAHMVRCRIKADRRDDPGRKYEVIRHCQYRLRAVVRVVVVLEEIYLSPGLITRVPVPSLLISDITVPRHRSCATRI